MNGTYLEYMCPTCGWFPSIKITKDNEEKTEELMRSRIKEHNATHPNYSGYHILFCKRA